MNILPSGPDNQSSQQQEHHPPPEEEESVPIATTEKSNPTRQETTIRFTLLDTMPADQGQSNVRDEERVGQSEEG